MSQPGAIVIGDAAVDTPDSAPGQRRGRRHSQRYPAGSVTRRHGGATQPSPWPASASKLLSFLPVGADGYGDYLKQALMATGVDIRDVQVVPGRFTLNVIVIIDQSGERYFARASG